MFNGRKSSNNNKKRSQIQAAVKLMEGDEITDEGMLTEFLESNKVKHDLKMRSSRNA